MSKIKILAVDDEHTNLEILEEIFFDEDYDFQTLADSQEAIKRINEFSPDVLLLDIMMPNVNGLDICREVRLSGAHPFIKIMLVSGKGMIEEKVEGYDAGADDYIVKPFIDDEIAAKVKAFAKLVEIEKSLQNDKEVLEEKVEAYSHQLVQSEKLASLGQLAAGIAHEINNPVGFISSNISSLSQYIESIKTLVGLYGSMLDATKTTQAKALESEIKKIEAFCESEDINFVMDDMAEIITESLEGVDRVKEIVNGLKTFARADDSKLEEADINGEIDKAIKLVWNELKYHCTLEKDYSELPLINCYPRQLSQVFMNMMVNASHAMEDTKGIIKISTRANGDNVEIEFSDNGKGIAKDKLEKIFEPFFTTKDVGKGTGLGLSISYGIVQKHHGSLSVTSQVGTGTTFKIVLPVVDEDKFTQAA